MSVKAPKYRFKDGLHPAIASDHRKCPAAVIDCATLPIQEQAKLCSDRIAYLTQKLTDYRARGLRANPPTIAEYEEAIAKRCCEAQIAEEQTWLQSLTTIPQPPTPVNSPLLMADSINRLGLTVTQVFYLVGQQLKKGLCRFVKTDRLKDAVCTLLAIKGKRRQVQDIRLGETKGSLRVFTDQGEEYVPSAEVSAFLTRYNQLAAHGIQGECKCDDVWKHFCPHRIAEHLTSVKQKIEVVAQAITSLAASEDLDAKAQLEEEKARSEQQEVKRYTGVPTIFQSKGQLRRKEIQMHERHSQDLIARKNELFSALVESGNLEHHMQVQKAVTSSKLTLRNAQASPYSTDVVNPKTNEKLGTLLLDQQQGWMVRLADGAEALVGSLLEALVILKEPTQLALDF